MRILPHASLQKTDVLRTRQASGWFRLAISLRQVVRLVNRKSFLKNWQSFLYYVWGSGHRHFLVAVRYWSSVLSLIREGPRRTDYVAYASSNRQCRYLCDVIPFRCRLRVCLGSKFLSWFNLESSRVHFTRSLRKTNDSKIGKVKKFCCSCW